MGSLMLGSLMDGHVCSGRPVGRFGGPELLCVTLLLIRLETIISFKRRYHLERNQIIGPGVRSIRFVSHSRHFTRQTPLP